MRKAPTVLEKSPLAKQVLLIDLLAPDEGKEMTGDSATSGLWPQGSHLTLFHKVNKTGFLEE